MEVESDAVIGLASHGGKDSMRSDFTSFFASRRPIAEMSSSVTP